MNPIHCVETFKPSRPWEFCMKDDQSVLEQKLDQFKEEMLAKFRLRSNEWGKNSVTRDDFDWRSYPLQDVQNRFLDEIAERFPDRQDPMPDEVKEDVDVANMAFLDWAMRKARAMS